MPGFVIEYHRESGDRRVYVFPGPGGRQEALQRRFELESEHIDDGWEVVTLVSDSLDTIKRTHSRYFSGRELAPLG